MDRAKERVAARGRIRERIRRERSVQPSMTRSASSLEKEAGAKGSNAAAAKAVGALIAKKAKDKGVTRVVFDRGGYLYHGNIKALADAARENGLEF